jgi:hypothetical protein
LEVSASLGSVEYVLISTLSDNPSSSLSASLGSVEYVLISTLSDNPSSSLSVSMGLVLVGIHLIAIK